MELIWFIEANSWTNKKWRQERKRLCYNFIELLISAGNSEAWKSTTGPSKTPRNLIRVYTRSQGTSKSERCSNTNWLILYTTNDVRHLASKSISSAPELVHQFYIISSPVFISVSKDRPQIKSACNRYTISASSVDSFIFYIVFFLSLSIRSRLCPRHEQYYSRGSGTPLNPPRPRIHFAGSQRSSGRSLKSHRCVDPGDN